MRCLAELSSGTGRHVVFHVTMTEHLEQTFEIVYHVRLVRVRGCHCKKVYKTRVRRPVLPGTTALPQSFIVPCSRDTHLDVAASLVCGPVNTTQLMEKRMY